jgi:23S rRNA pseudouridine1911/1915/1917 synthase
VVGDPVYGGRRRLPPDASEHLREILTDFRRQALHAARLELQHPGTGETVSWESAMPDDMAALILALREDAGKHGGD